jgi:hypothetical protein
MIHVQRQQMGDAVHMTNRDETCIMNLLSNDPKSNDERFPRGENCGQIVQ